MKRPRRIALVLAVLVVFASVFFHPAVYWPVTGWVRGEAFYDGRPTSYWSHAIRRWGNDSAALSWMDKTRVGVGLSRCEAVPRPVVIGDHFDPFDPFLRYPATANIPHLPTGVDRAAMPVLVELLRDQKEAVRLQAAAALISLATDGKISDAEARALVGDELMTVLEPPSRKRGRSSGRSESHGRSTAWMSRSANTS